MPGQRGGIRAGGTFQSAQIRRCGIAQNNAAAPFDQLGSSLKDRTRGVIA